MSDYSPPLQDYQFVLNHIAGMASIIELPGCEDISTDIVDAILMESGRLCSEVLAPLNQVGDREGSVLENGVVRTPTGFKEAYAAYAEGGWTSMNGLPEWGGQALPWAITTAVGEMAASANLAFSLCPMLSQAAIELLQDHGSAAQKNLYLPRLNSGEWAATMNLTEPQAGSDLGRVRTRAVPEGDHYRITGQKIFITFGEHDLTDNIIHLVLARTPDAPPGTRGISLFVVPKILINADETLGTRNDLRCISLEEKLGIHASPTAVMSYGDDQGAIGHLIGEENHGLEYMFTMMNNSRLGVGIQGVAIAERATQAARNYAWERLQGRALGDSSGDAVPIIHHPDVRRMLLSMRCRTEACRAGALYTASCQDIANRHEDAEKRQQMQERLDLLTPIVKAWSTDVGIEVANMGIQVHGGVGYIEETGAAQIFRDGRITAIYEGTNGIQANDLVGRKVIRDEGRSLQALLAEIAETASDLACAERPEDRNIGLGLEAACQAADQSAAWLQDQHRDDPPTAFAGAADFLQILGDLTGGWLMGKELLAARKLLEHSPDDADFLEQKIRSAQFYVANFLTVLPARAQGMINSAPLTAATAVEDI